jgi:hypothetical protein
VIPSRDAQPLGAVTDNASLDETDVSYGEIIL